VIGTIADQHDAHTAPRVGSSSGLRHAAQAGARRIETSPSTALRSVNNVNALGITP
jgi:hypothetical protein